ncbi:MAG: tRNA (adenosine(37)-N6)-threonylcarbamoyltransferase complex ATPase subunit type 1 TsaE [Spirochaetes bacterium GWD1_27_9]|nr:MAG: tRNA (adenosine(37)-N6)-threonylcarbamoyltransferase complex ATPase subunit type 1 TsaE [Spirochaetes bacterium GWB1_27_13]OHD20380.1 MAG: tRNA (adenosine(37)-N6)-threonylcarbamoyltransferase complex ATPase subunit type 1 TsaE [Spirochaetes bacterium GWC1_27_15]OHD29103.1 MAG: tRNA (adenosine(37)-N6)-threonylcarbamoyltransferase complex ATPase subunit type 1 TsaE [Spirochaetes bacterium GWD1_27_9]
MKKFYSNSEENTFLLAKEYAQGIKSGDVILLEGTLGAGKSIFARGLLAGLDVDSNVPSPTFTLVNEYKGKYTIYHFDFYRLNDPFELYEIGFEDYIYSDGVSLIEWAEKGGDLIPTNSIKVTIKITSDNEREIVIQ